MNLLDIAKAKAMYVAVPQPSGKITITENGTGIDIAQYATADVNVSGGGGETWQTVFEGSVTTVDRDGFADGLIGDFVLTANSIKVTFNGTEYTCERNEDDTYGAENIIPTGYDFSEYPFCITYDGVLITPNAGTYTLKIEEEQSGGSSDFSTATVTINKGAMGTQVNGIIPWFSEEDNQTYSTIELVDEETLTVKVPVGGGSITVLFSRSAQSTNGNIESLGDVSFMSKTLKSYLITGDCSISFT